MKKIQKILLVDDDETSNFITELMVKSSGLVNEIIILGNGKEAMEYFARNPETYPELILLDINMPLWDGFEFLDWYEKNGYAGTTKFAIFSTSQREVDKKRSTEFKDVIGFIEKPITQAKLKQLHQQI